MAGAPPFHLPNELRSSLASAFFIRLTTVGRRTGRSRTTETTYVWDGDRTITVSGYPGRPDWLANMAANPRVVVHTVEGAGYDIAAMARVLRERDERTPPLLAFLERWASRPEAPRALFSLLVRAIRLNLSLRLPWWGPYYLVRRIMDRMPCVEITFVSAPVRRRGPPPHPDGRLGP